VFIISLPLADATGAFAGVVYVNTSNRRIEELFTSIQLGEHGIVTLFDADRRILIRHPALQEMVDEQVVRVAAPGTIEALTAGRSVASYTAPSPFDGLRRSISFRRIAHYPVYVLVGQAERDYLAPWWRECWM